MVLAMAAMVETVSSTDEHSNFYGKTLFHEPCQPIGLDARPVLVRYMVAEAITNARLLAWTKRRNIADSLDGKATHNLGEARNKRET